MAKILKLTEQEIINCYHAGKTQKEIAKLCGVANPFWQIIPILKKHNLPTRRTNMPRGKKKIKLDIDYFKSIDTKEKAYWLGFLYADGCIKKDKVSLLLADKEPVVAFKKAINSGHKLSKSIYFDKRTQKKYTRYTIQVCCQVFGAPLRQRGIFHKTSKNYVFPNDIPKDLYFHFIRGLFDGDGYVSDINKRKLLRVSLIASINILKFIQEILYDDYKIKKTKIQVVTKNNLDIGKMLLYKDAGTFLKLIYENSDSAIRLNRKYIKYLSYIS